MRKFLTVAAAALTLAAVAPAPGFAQSRSAAERAEIRAAEAWTAEAVQWSNGYNDILTTRILAIGELNQGVTRALEFANAGDAAAGRAWAAEWGPEQRRRFADLRARLQRLNASPMPKPVIGGVDYSREPSVAAFMKLLQNQPADVDRQLRRTEALTDKVIDLAVKAASGDAAAVEPLQSAVFDLNIEALEAEIDMMEAQLRIPTPGNPQDAVVAAAIAINRAYIQAMHMLRPGSVPSRAERTEAAGRIRREAAAIDAQLPRIRSLSRDLIAGPNDPSSYRTKLDGLRREYETSAVALGEVASAMRGLADAIERGPVLDSGRVGAAIGATVPPFERHVAANERRRQLLAQPAEPAPRT